MAEFDYWLLSVTSLRARCVRATPGHRVDTITKSQARLRVLRPGRKHNTFDCSVNAGQTQTCCAQLAFRGVDPYGTGGTRPPPIFGLGDMITNAPPNISRVISATFYPCNIFLIS